MAETRRVLITGGTKGLGFALAREFLKAGCRVFITGRNIDTARKAAALLAAEPGAVTAAGAVFSSSGDSGVWEDNVRLASEATAAMGGIDIWVNNAGVNQGGGMVWELPPEIMETVLRTDLLGPMLGAKAVGCGLSRATARTEGSWQASRPMAPPNGAWAICGAHLPSSPVPPVPESKSALLAPAS